MKPILILEMNEIPWRLIDLYSGNPGYPHLDAFFSASRTFTTVAVDTGELSPWVTWPTMHRGMNNERHGVFNLGQDPATFRGVPIWQEFRNRGESVGIFGSLQSWPPLDPGPGGFFVPDTFAHDARVIPSHIQPFQSFNLGQVRCNGRVVDRRLALGRDMFHLAASIPRLGVSFRTMARVAGQLASEPFDRNRVARRPVFQTILTWDIFKSLFNPAAPPAFSTFFTNHVAGVMHRYWHHVFPEDFGGRFASEPKVHRPLMDFAMGVVDSILGDALRFRERNPELSIIFATSMGQAAIIRDEHEGYEASIPFLDAFMSAFGAGAEDYTPLLAMVPQVAVEMPDAAKRRSMKIRLEGGRTESGAELFRTQEIGKSLSITIVTPRGDDRKAGGFRLPGESGEAWLSWEEAGIRMNRVDPGTAYHIPEGVLAVLGCGLDPGDLRTRVPADDFKGMIMDWSGYGNPSAIDAQPSPAAFRQ